MAELSNDALFATFGAPPAQSITPAAPAISPVTQTPTPAGQGTSGVAYVAQPVTTRGDKSSLPAVAHGMRLEESGDSQFAADGSVKLGPKTKYGQAVGISQIMPGTETPGVDLNDETQNREEGERRLGTLYDKYGNWKDSLVAYNWGEGNTDKWLAKGGDPNALPSETRKYVPQVLANAGLDTSSITNAKQELTDADIAAAMKTDAEPAAPSNLQDAIGQAMTSVGESGEPVDAATGEAFAGQAEALVQGARKGLTDLVTGPIQLGLEAVSPQDAARFTAMMNRMESSYGGADAQREHPVFSFTGQMLGLVGAMWATGGMLGPLVAGNATAQTAAAMTKTIPAAIRAAGVGGFLGATQYNPDPENASRWLEGILGATLGGAAAEVGQGVSWLARKAADRGTYLKELETIKDGVREMARNAKGPLDSFIGHVEGLWAQNNRLYGGRQPGTEGFEATPFRAALREPVEETRMNGVAVAPATRTWAKRAYEELGLPADDAARAGAEQQAKDHAAQLEAWTKTYTSGLENLPEESRTVITQRDIANGRIPAPPTAPDAHIPADITPQQFSAAQTAVNRGIRQTRRDAAAQHQLKALGHSLQLEAEAQAARLGMDVKTYMRQTEKANEFWKNNIEPVRRIFGTATPSQLREQLTPAKFFDKVGALIKRNDTTEIAQFKAAVGPKGLADMRRIALWNVLNKGQPKTGGKFVAQQAVKYIRDNQDALQSLFGRNGVATLQGWAKVAERVAANPMGHTKLLGGFFSSALPYIGMERFAEHAMTGNLKAGIIEGGSLMAAPIFAHAIFAMASKAERLPGVTPLIKAMSHLPADSPQLEARVQRLQALFARAGSIAARGQSTLQAGPTPASDPLAQMGQ